jgi:hypothetical protein
MTSYKQLILILSLMISLIGCKPQGNKSNDKYCGYELTPQEFNVLNQKASEQRSTIYKSDSLWSIYDQVNDTLRKSISDTIVFEVFLNTLDEDQFSIMVISPKNQEYLETLACKFMNANFQGTLPKNRVLLMYSYTNSDGSGETPLEFAIKKNR